MKKHYKGVAHSARRNEGRKFSMTFDCTQTVNFSTNQFHNNRPTNEREKEKRYQLIRGDSQIAKSNQNLLNKIKIANEKAAITKRNYKTEVSCFLNGRLDRISQKDYSYKNQLLQEIRLKGSKTISIHRKTLYNLKSPGSELVAPCIRMVSNMPSKIFNDEQQCMIYEYLRAKNRNSQTKIDRFSTRNMSEDFDFYLSMLKRSKALNPSKFLNEQLVFNERRGFFAYQRLRVNDYNK